MSLSERMHKVGGADKPERRLVPVDGLSEFKVAISNELFERLGQRLFETQSQERLYATVVEEIRSIIAAEEAPLTEDERHRLTLEIARDVMGYGPIEKFLDDESVSEVMVNGTGFIYIEQDGRITATHARFISEEHLSRVIDRIVSLVGRRIDESSPMVDARLPDGSRVNVIVPPLSLDGSILTIRKFAKDTFQAADL